MTKIKQENLLFNTLKHHLSIQLAITKEKDERAFYRALLKLGGSQMDVYIGKLQADEIAQECISKLNELQITTYDRYLSLLQLKQGYFSMQLSDKSIWVFRLGNEEERFVHIHPGRNSPHTTRMKASTLKTVLSLLYEGFSEIDLGIVNQIRTEKLDLSPIKKFNFDDGIGKLWKSLKAYQQQTRTNN